MSIFKSKPYVTYSHLRSELNLLQFKLDNLQKEGDDSKLTIDLILKYLEVEAVRPRDDPKVSYLVEDSE